MSRFRRNTRIRPAARAAARANDVARRAGARLMRWRFGPIARAWSASLRPSPRPWPICAPASEMGFGALADPQRGWRAGKPGAVLGPGARLAPARAAGRLRLAARDIPRRALGEIYSRGLREISAADGARSSAGRFSRAGGGDPARDSAQWRDQRRCLAGAAAHSRRHGAHARNDSEDARAHPARRAGAPRARITSRGATIAS